MLISFFFLSKRNEENKFQFPQTIFFLPIMILITSDYIKVSNLINN
jgi:hypothetical protein